MIYPLGALTCFIIINCLQEDSEKTGKVTSAGMYFLHFQVYRMDTTVNAVCRFSSSFCITLFHQHSFSDVFCVSVVGNN